MRVRLIGIDGEDRGVCTVPDESLPVAAVVCFGTVFVWHGRTVDGMCQYDEARAYWWPPRGTAPSLIATRPT